MTVIGKFQYVLVLNIYRITIRENLKKGADDKQSPKNQRPRLS